MTAPTLPGTLSKLAQLLPERVSVKEDARGNRFYYVWRGASPGFTGHAAHIYTYSSKYPDSLSRMDGLILEYALRDECEARGWMLSLQGNGAGRDWLVVVRTGKFKWLSHAEGPTPAHALALALIAALE